MNQLNILGVQVLKNISGNILYNSMQRFTAYELCPIGYTYMFTVLHVENALYLFLYLFDDQVQCH